MLYFFFNLNIFAFRFNKTHYKNVSSLKQWRHVEINHEKKQVVLFLLSSEHFDIFRLHTFTKLKDFEQILN